MRWTKRQETLLKQKYAETPMSKLMTLLCKSQKAIYCKAIFLDLHKSKKYLSELGRIKASHPNIVATRFKKKTIPSNKGGKQKYKSKESEERSKSTQFKAGHSPHNTRPIGYEKIYSDGYIHIKVEEGKRMQLKHHYVWRLHYGEIPRDMCVAFCDGNRLNCDISNLILITKKDEKKWMTSALSPEKLRRRTQKAQSSRNESIRKDKMRIRWGLEPKTKLVKKWHAPNE